MRDEEVASDHVTVERCDEKSCLRPTAVSGTSHAGRIRTQLGRHRLALARRVEVRVVSPIEGLVESWRLLTGGEYFELGVEHAWCEALAHGEETVESELELGGGEASVAIVQSFEQRVVDEEVLTQRSHHVGSLLAQSGNRPHDVHLLRLLRLVQQRVKRHEQTTAPTSALTVDH